MPPVLESIFTFRTLTPTIYSSINIPLLKTGSGLGLILKTLWEHVREKANQFVLELEIHATKMAPLRLHIGGY